MKKSLKATLVSALALFMLAGCAFSPATSAESLSSVSSSAGTVLTSALSDSTPDSSVSRRDASGEYDAEEAVTLSPDEELTITEEGVYILSGDYEGMIVIEAGEEDKVQLVLNNADLANENGPAIYVRSADKVFITAAEGTVNTISDGADYTLSDDDTTLDAAVFSKEDLTINGSGKITINGSYKHAVVSKDDLVITAKDLTVKAENVGLSGKDSVKLSGATVTITAGSDGIRSDNGSDEGKGFVSVVDSKVTIESGKDGIQAETVFTAENVEITGTAGGGSSARNGDASESYKGIKAGVSVTISGGVCRIDSLDDARTTGSTRTKRQRSPGARWISRPTRESRRPASSSAAATSRSRPRTTASTPPASPPPSRRPWRSAAEAFRSRWARAIPTGSTPTETSSSPAARFP